MDEELMSVDLRDYFAAKAISEANWVPGDEMQNLKCAKFCYEVADAMLKIRDNK